MSRESGWYVRYFLYVILPGLFVIGLWFFIFGNILHNESLANSFLVFIVVSLVSSTMYYFYRKRHLL